MEQQYNQSGESILNPAELWKNVLAGKNHRFPTFLLYCANQSDLDLFLEIIGRDWVSRPKFIVVYGEVAFDMSIVASSALFLAENSIRDEERKRTWADVDYLFGNFYVLEAMYSGVSVLDSPKTLEATLGVEWVPSAQRRVDARDGATKYLANY